MIGNDTSVVRTGKRGTTEKLDSNRAPDLTAARSSARWVAVVAAAGVVAACSSVPDAVNPVEWYHSTVDYFSDDDAAMETETASSRSASEEAKRAGYPDINQTGERPTAMSDEDRRKMAESLVADKSSARYASGQIRRQGDAVSPLAAGPAVGGGTQPTRQSVQVQAPTVQVRPVTPRAPRMASAPTTVIQGSVVTTMSATSGPVTVAEIYRANLQQRRPTGGGGKISQPAVSLTAPGGPMRSANYPGSPVGGDFETLVISGDGIESGGYAPVLPQHLASANRALAPVALKVVAQGLARPLGEFPAGAFRNSFKVATLQFGVGSAQMTGREQSILNKVVQLHRERGGKIRVIGHASRRTRDMGMRDHLQVNYNVSVQRADRVARKLVGLGIKADDLYVGAVADSQPQYAEVMPAGEAGNRRTEIFIDY